MAGKTKYVYFFGAGQTEGNANMRELLGGKGANLAEMAGLGLPVPQGFTITTEVPRSAQTRLGVAQDLQYHLTSNTHTYGGTYKIFKFTSALTGP